MPLSAANAPLLLLIPLVGLASCGTAPTAASSARPITAVAATDEIPNPAFRTDIPLELETRPPLLVRARINDAEPAWFYVDTGATGMVVTPEQAAAAKMPELPAVSVHGAAAFEAKCRACRSFELGPLLLHDLTFVEIDVGFIGDDPSMPVAGIIGADVFRRAIVEIDLGTPAVRIRDPRTYSIDTRRWQPLVMTERGPAVRCRFEAGGGVEGPQKEAEGLFVLDTGGNFGIGFHQPTVEKLGLLNSRQTRPQASRGVGGVNYGRRGRLAWFDLAGNRITDAPAVFFGPRDGVEYDADMYGMIGSRVLSRFVVVFDYAGSRVAFLPRQQSP